MSDDAGNKFLKDKKESKKMLSKTLSLLSDKPMLGIFIDHDLSEMAENKLREILEGTKALSMQVVILADSNLEALSSGHIKILEYTRKNRKALLDAADMSLVFPFSDVEEMLIHGIIPISMARSEISDYNPNKESGNAFIYENDDSWSIFAALVRAAETYKFPYDWKHIIRQGIESVQSDQPVS